MPRFSSKRRVHHTAAQMFDLVADVERYPEFVPLCQSLRIRQRTSRGDGTEIIVADMTVSFKLVRARSATSKTAGRSSRGPKPTAMSAFSCPTNSGAGCWRC
jgi:coenzyme Q-binding protein COQ10